MTGPAHARSCWWLTLAAVALAPSPALGDGPHPRPRPAFRIVVGAEAVASNVRESPRLAGGGRLSAGFQLPRFRLFGVLEAEGPLGPVPERAHLGALVLGGAGIGYLERDRTLLHAGLLGGGEVISRRDYLNGGSMAFGSLAGGARIGLTFRPVAPGDRFRIGSTVGLAFTTLFVQKGSDPLTGVRWGGWTPMVTLSIGAELRRSHVEPPRAIGSAEESDEPAAPHQRPPMSWGGFTPTLTLSFGAELQLPAFGRRPRVQDPVPGAEGAPGR